MKTTKVALTGEKRDAKLMLDAIVKFLNVGDQESVNLWGVLTALRGPDSGNDEIKGLTTSRLRHDIGLREYSNEFYGYFLTNAQPLVAYKGDISPASASLHFVSHFNEAVRSLQNLRERHNMKVQKEVNEKLDSFTREFNNRVGFNSGD